MNSDLMVHGIEFIFFSIVIVFNFVFRKKHSYISLMESSPLSKQKKHIFHPPLFFTFSYINV